MMRARWWLSGLISLGFLVGCGQTSPSHPERFPHADAAVSWLDSGDPGDGPIVVPTLRNATSLVLASYRIEAFPKEGSTARYVFKLESPIASQLTVEGPYENGDAADAAVPGTGPVVKVFDFAAGANAFQGLALTQPGVYRLIPNAADALTRKEPLTLTVECRKNCSRTALSLTQIRDHLRAEEKKQGTVKAMLVAAAIKAGLRKLSDKNAWGAKVAERIEADFLSNKPIPELVLPEVSQLSEFLPALEGMENDPQRGDVRVKGKFRDLLGPCDFDRRDEGKPIHAAIPDVKYGHYNSQAMSKCELAHSKSLARILTALALNGSPHRDDSSVDIDGGQSLHSVAEVFDYLIETGHQIEMRHERTYANFLALKLPHNTESRIALWVDTGVNLSDADKSPFLIPMGHSQAAWRIWGPLVRARVAVFLGISGAGFYPQTDSRPAWTGLKRLRSYLAHDVIGYKKNIDAVLNAGKYLRRNRIERNGIERNGIERKGLPADGYGILGVCNDSTAVIERETPIPFPLLRRSSFNGPTIDDGLNAFLRSLPHDTDIVSDTLSGAAVEARRKSIFCRALNMSPHAPNSEQIWDPRLKAGLEEAAVNAPNCFR